MPKNSGYDKNSHVKNILSNRQLTIYEKRQQLIFYFNTHLINTSELKVLTNWLLTLFNDSEKPDKKQFIAIFNALIKATSLNAITFWNEDDFIAIFVCIAQIIPHLDAAEEKELIESFSGILIKHKLQNYLSKMLEMPVVNIKTLTFLTLIIKKIKEENNSFLIPEFIAATVSTIKLRLIESGSDLINIEDLAKFFYGISALSQENQDYQIIVNLLLVNLSRWLLEHNQALQQTILNKNINPNHTLFYFIHGLFSIPDNNKTGLWRNCANKLKPIELIKMTTLEIEETPSHEKVILFPQWFSIITPLTTLDFSGNNLSLLFRINKKIARYFLNNHKKFFPSPNLLMQLLNNCFMTPWHKYIKNKTKLFEFKLDILVAFIQSLNPISIQDEIKKNSDLIKLFSDFFSEKDFENKNIVVVGQTKKIRNALTASKNSVIKKLILLINNLEPDANDPLWKMLFFEIQFRMHNIDTNKVTNISDQLIYAQFYLKHEIAIPKKFYTSLMTLITDPSLYDSNKANLLMLILDRKKTFISDETINELYHKLLDKKIYGDALDESQVLPLMLKLLQSCHVKFGTPQVTHLLFSLTEKTKHCIGSLSLIDIISILTGIIHTNYNIDQSPWYEFITTLFAEINASIASLSADLAICVLYTLTCFSMRSEAFNFDEYIQLEEQLVNIANVNNDSLNEHSQSMLISYNIIKKIPYTMHVSALSSPISSFQEEIYNSLLMRKMYFGDALKIGDMGFIQPPYSIDIPVYWRGKKIAIQADEKHHYAYQENNKAMINPPANYQTLLRNEVLRQTGWEVLIITRYDWEEYTNREYYLQQKLAHFLYNSASIKPDNFFNQLHQVNKLDPEVANSETPKSDNVNRKILAL